MTKTRKSTYFEAFALSAVFAVNAILFLTPSISSFYFAGYVDSNLGHFHGYSALIASGQLPYRDFIIEYPPLTVLFLCSLAPFSADFATFRSAFLLVMVFLSSACWLAMRPVADKQHQPALLAAYLLAVVSVGPIALVSFDYLPVFFTILTLLFLRRGRPAVAGICLGAATALKGYPAVLLVPLVALAWRRSSARSAILAFCGWAASLALSLLPALALDAPGLIKSLTYHSERSVELGSAYSAFLLPLKFAGAEFATKFDHGSWNLTGNPLADNAARVSPVILLALVGIAWIKILHEILRERPLQAPTSPPPHLPTPAHLFALPVAAFMLGFKVGSPQFLLWLLPFVPLMATGGTGWLPMALFILTGHCQQWIFPWHWSSLVHLRPLPIVILALEKTFLVALALTTLPFGFNIKHRHKTIN